MSTSPCCAGSCPISPLLCGLGVHLLQSMAILSTVVLFTLADRHVETTPLVWENLFYGLFFPWLVLGLILAHIPWSIPVTLAVMLLEWWIWVFAAMCGHLPSIRSTVVLFLYVTVAALLSIVGAASWRCCLPWSPATQLGVHVVAVGVLQPLVWAVEFHTSLGTQISLDTMTLQQEAWQQGWIHLLLGLFMAGEVARLHRLRLRRNSEAFLQLGSITFARILVVALWTIGQGLALVGRTPDARPAWPQLSWLVGTHEKETAQTSSTSTQNCHRGGLQ
jgi:hypothetical protein